VFPDPGSPAALRNDHADERAGGPTRRGARSCAAPRGRA